MDNEEQAEQIEEAEQKESLGNADNIGNNEVKNEKKEILVKTAKEYFNAAEDEFNKARYNSAVVLYFKSLVALVDLFILQKTGDTPSSHTDRFRTSERNFPEVYDLLDKNFPFYQNSYFQIMSKELAEVIKDDTKIMAEKTQVEL